MSNRQAEEKIVQTFIKSLAEETRRHPERLDRTLKPGPKPSVADFFAYFGLRESGVTPGGLASTADLKPLLALPEFRTIAPGIARKQAPSDEDLGRKIYEETLNLASKSKKLSIDGVARLRKAFRRDSIVVRSLSSDIINQIRFFLLNTIHTILDLRLEIRDEVESRYHDLTDWSSEILQSALIRILDDDVRSLDFNQRAPKFRGRKVSMPL